MSLPNLNVLSLNPSTQQWTLHLPTSLIKKLGKKEVSLQLGAEGIENRVVVSSAAPAPGSVSSRVKIKNYQGVYQAGPMIGILTVKRGSHFKGNSKNFIDIIRTAKQLGGLVFVFNVEDINWTSHTTGAYFYVENQATWTYVSNVPLPHVVYNRIPYREDEQKEYVQRAIRQLQTIPSLSLYNHHFFNKWNLYQTLGQMPNVAKYIPDTVKLASEKDLSHMLLKHGSLYLKPISGKAGKGIMTVEQKDNSYILKERSQNQLITRRFKNVKQLWRRIKGRMGDDYVVQQAISLMKYNDRPFDIRVLVQKDDSGTWKLSGVGIRVAGKNSITTHVPRGGSIAAPEDVLGKIMPRAEYDRFTTRLTRAVLELAESLDKSYQSLGEVSMDIGMTKERQIWFFEANAKPMKFDEPHIRKTSLERIIQYSQYLSHFSSKEGETRANQASNT